MIFQKFISAFLISRSCLWVQSANSAVALPFTYLALLLSRLPLYTMLKVSMSVFLFRQGHCFFIFFNQYVFKFLIPSPNFSFLLLFLKKANNKLCHAFGFPVCVCICLYVRASVCVQALG